MKESKEYLVNFANSISEMFDFISSTKLSEDLYITLKDEGFTDNKIANGLAKSRICSYLVDNRFRLKISDKFYETRDVVYETVNEYYNECMKDARKNTGSLYNQFNSNPQARKHMTYEIIISLMQNGMSLDEIKEENLYNFISNYISEVRVKENSISKKSEIKCERENRIYHIPSHEAVKRFLITTGIIFGLLWIDNMAYNHEQKQKEKEDNKPKYEYSVKKIPSQKQLIDNALQMEFSMENNNPKLGG